MTSPSTQKQALYTDDDERYRDTKLNSGIPPPSASNIPRMIRQPKGRRQILTRQPSLPPHTPVQVDPGVSARVFTVITNPMSKSLEQRQQLATPEWLRMMSDRDDVRGRRSDPRLCDIRQLQAIDGSKSEMAKTMSTEVINAAIQSHNKYAALSHQAKETLGKSGSSITLGHLDYLLQPVKELLGNQGDIRFVDLGSKQGGFTEYILWQTKRQQPNKTAHGWYFGCGSGQCSNEAVVKFMARAGPHEILDPSNVTSFIDSVNGSNQPSGVDLVVGDCDSSQPDYSLELEKLQYTYTIAQAVIALRLLKQGGNFIFKVYDVTTPLSAELLFLISACFERMAIVRSPMSRQTNSERYVVCNRLLSTDTQWLSEHLLAALAKIHAGRMKLSHLVSWTRVSAERTFMEPLFKFNSQLAQTQSQALKTVVASKSTTSVQPLTQDQRKLADFCLQHWGLLI